MAKKIKKEEEVEELTVENAPVVPTKAKVLPITENFSNGEVNVLRDKINEIIKTL